ncbi:MAG: ATP-dependent DNA helicase RecG, partial [Novosphingobium sp.]|nr:ATP-dependent DNA helicase RecG [Novosphingobium sp.]
MRPDLLNPLFAEVAGLKGVGPQLAKPLETLALTRVKDLAYHLPERFVQRRAVAVLDEADVGEQIVIALTPREYRTSSGRGPFRVLAEESAGDFVALT